MDNYEELLKEYNEIAEKLEKEDLSLDDSIRLYEESNIIYDKLNLHLSKAKQKIYDLRNENV